MFKILMSAPCQLEPGIFMSSVSTFFLLLTLAPEHKTALDKLLDCLAAGRFLFEHSLCESVLDQVLSTRR